MNVYSSFVFNDPKPETIPKSPNRRIDKCDHMIKWYSEVPGMNYWLTHLFNMDESPNHYIEWKKPDDKRVHTKWFHSHKTLGNTNKFIRSQINSLLFELFWPYSYILRIRISGAPLTSSKSLMEPFNFFCGSFIKWE